MRYDPGMDPGPEAAERKAPRLVLVVAHPDPGSFNHALAGSVASAARAAGAEVRLHDLYADGFDPRLHASEIGTTLFADPVAASYAEDLLNADAVAVVHPIWFFQVPAVLKGWVDRVVREEIAFRVGSGGRVTGLLKAGAALVVTTGNAAPGLEREVFGDPVEAFWRQVVFTPAGVPRVRRLGFAPVKGSSVEQRTAWLAEAGVAAGEVVRSVRRKG